MMNSRHFLLSLVLFFLFITTNPPEAMMAALPFLIHPRILFDKPDDGGAGGGGEPADNSTTDSTDSADGGGEPAAPDGGQKPPEGGKNNGYDPDTDPDLLEAMRMTEEMSGKGADGEAADSTDSADDSDADDSTTDSADSADDKDAGEVREGFEADDLVEVDGESFFYHPKEFGEETGQGTSYKSRDDAELAWGNKVAAIQSKIESLKELGKDVGPIELPEWLQNPEASDAFEQLIDVDYPLELKNDDLRQHIKEADKLFTYLNKREKGIREEVETTTQTKEVEENLNSIYDRISDSLDELGLTEKLHNKEFETDQDLQNAIQAQIDQKVAADLKADVEKYKQFRDDQDAKIDDPKYGEKLENMFKELEDKRKTLTDQYREKHLGVFSELQEVRSKAENLKSKEKSSEISEKERLKKINEGFQGLQKEFKDSHVIFQSTDPKGAQHFYNWAMKNIDEFDGLQTEYAWGKALRSFDKHLENRRAEIRKQKIEEENRKKEEANKDMPPYGDKQDLLGKDAKPGKHDKLQKEVDDLVKETEKSLKNR